MMTLESRHVNGYVGSRFDNLFRELATLRAENKLIRSKLATARRGSSVVRRAVVDAHTVLMAAFSEESTGCRAMEVGHGVSRRRWEWAVALLRYAGIVAMRTRNWRNGLEFVIVDLDEAIRLLEVAARELDSEMGYRRLLSTKNARKV